MTIAFNCSSCSQHYRVAIENAGKTARCKKCGEVCRVPDAPRGERPSASSHAPTLPPAHNQPPEHRELSRARLAAFAGVGVLVLCGIIYGAISVFGGRGEPASVKASPATPVQAKPALSDDDRVREPVVRWLEELKRGGNGRSHWRTLPSAQTSGDIYGGRPHLYSVRSYEILSVEIKPATEFQDDGLKRLGIVMVRVEASDRDGHPNIKTYRVRVGDDGSSMFLLGAI